MAHHTILLQITNEAPLVFTSQIELDARLKLAAANHNLTIEEEPTA